MVSKDNSGAAPLSGMVGHGSQWAALSPGAAITHWAMSTPVAVAYPGRKRPMPDRVDYRFVNGWVDTGDLPCREALRAEIATRTVQRPTGPFADVFVGSDGPECDFSQFMYRPTLVRRGFQCLIKAATTGTARFRLRTCGGVNLWLGAAHVGQCEPFCRNKAQTQDIAFAVTEGEHELTLLLEDLHERDTTCMFSITYLGGPALETALQSDSDPATIEHAKRVLAGLHTGAVFHADGAIMLGADPPPEYPITITVEGPAPFMRGGLSTDPHDRRSVEVTLTPNAPSARIADVSECLPGCLGLTATTQVGLARLTRRIGTTNLPPTVVLTGDYAARKDRAESCILKEPSFEPSVAALLAARRTQPTLVARIVKAALTTIEQRHDCSDFSILPLLRIWRDSRDDLDPALRQRLRDALLGYRYWLDEPGDDVMWFWSENHVLCFHTAQILAGGLFPDAVFGNSGKSGKVLQQEARARLDRWFDAIARDGLCEWNSAAYYPIDLLALLTLHDMVPAFRARGAAVLDQIFVMTGLHTTGGVPAGTQGRCYEKELLAGPATELGTVGAMAFGGPFYAGYNRAAALLCLSDYAPPAIATRYAHPDRDAVIDARYTQGHGGLGRLCLWKSRDGQLSSVAELQTGQQGHQAQVVDVQMAAHPMARLWINHPGEVKVWGERRPSLLAGNHVMPRVAQSGPTALLIYDLARPWTDLAFTQMFAAHAAFSDHQTHQNWRILTAGAGHVAVWCSAVLQDAGGFYGKSLWRAHGARTAWIVAMSLPGEGPGQFRTRLAQSDAHFDVDALTLSCRDARGSRLRLPYDGPLQVDGTTTPFGPLTSVPCVGLNGAALRPWNAASHRAP